MSRFVSRLGFDNYAAFQQALRDDLSERVLSPVEVYRSHVADSDHSTLSRAGAALADAVTGTLAQLSPPDFERAVSLLADERHRVVMSGGWTSHLLAALLTSLVRPFRSGVHHVPSLAAERTAALADLVPRRHRRALRLSGATSSTRSSSRGSRASAAHGWSCSPTPGCRPSPTWRTPSCRPRSTGPRRSRA